MYHCNGAGTETRRNIYYLIPTDGEGMEHSEGTKTRKKTIRGRKTMEHVVARRSSLKQWGQYRNRETTQGEKKKKQNTTSWQRGRNGRVRDFAYTERAGINKKLIKYRHRHDLCNIVREKADAKGRRKRNISPRPALGHQVTHTRC